MGTKKADLAIASLIGLSPSLSVISGYLMTETLMLNLLAFWMTCRAIRKQI